MPYKDPVKQKEWQKEYEAKNKEKRKEYFETYRSNNKEKRKECYEINKEKEREQAAKRYEERKQHAHDSITSGIIIDKNKWNVWCRVIKRNAKINKKQYSEDFTNDVMFEMMLQGCFYCGDIATTIDRVDSKLDHTPENCVGCCYGCNMSKGAADPATFARKACYRDRGEYHDEDTDIWFVHKTKPRLASYKYDAKKQGVPFNLLKEDFDTLIKGNCAYCKRSPITWFGIDKIVPSLGYVLDNVVSCCYDCNLDKLDDDVDIMMVRNKRIANRVISGELVIPKCEKVILHRNQKTI